MKLLLFIHSLSSGGAERALVTLANSWAAKGWRLSVVTIASSDSDFYSLHPSIERYCLDLAGDSSGPVQALWSNWRRMVALRRLLRQCKPDVALGFMANANILLALSAARVKGVLAIGVEQVHPPRHPIGAAWEALRRWSYGKLTAVIALTEASGTWLANHTAARRVRVIPNPLAWPMEEIAPVVAPDSVGRAGRLRLLSVGRLVPQKGFDLLIKAFAICADMFPQWELVIVGEGPLREQLSEQIEGLGLDDRIFLPGRVGNIGAWYEQAHAYVMSSRFEGLGNVLIEAMGHGLPAVSFDCETGPGEIIKHGIDGLLVRPEDIDALAEAMAMLMVDERLRARLGKKAVEARHRCSLETVERQWNSVFAEIKSPL
jgi:glycosyltransferase involved in cell wall biosynthesis